MKKAYFYFLAIMLGLTLAACGNDDEPEVQPDDITTAELDLYSRTIKGNDVVFLKSKGTAVLNFTQGTIKLTCDYKDFEGKTHTVTTNVMQVSSMDGYTYSFNDPKMTGSYDGSTSSGYINTATGVILFTFTNEIGKIVTTTHLNFTTAQFKVQRIGDSVTYSHNTSDILFAPVDEGTQCIIQINKFVANMNGVVDADVIQFLGLPMTPTTDGYIITADRALSTFGPSYLITDVNIVIKSQCNVIIGSFKCNGYLFDISASYH